MPPLLRVEGLEAGYGDLVAVRDVSLTVEPGELVALIGSNGAGKTTTLRAICGLIPPRRGVIELAGARIDGLASAAIVARGIAHVPEGRQLFPSMTVRENLELGARTPESRRRRAETLAHVYALFPRLGERHAQLAGTLSGGEQQMAAIGRALMAGPRILMLDEPSLGLSPLLCRDLFRTLARIRDTGVGIFLVEQNARQSLAIADRGYLLDNGRIVGADTAAALSNNEMVKMAYLGGG
jgi:branched-chain amino acid transport system ATP-binding protein